MSKALDQFKLLIADVDNLIAHHPKSGSPLAGRPVGDEGPLVRSCVVLTYGAWEVYFEDSFVEAVQIMARGNRADLPTATLDWVRDMTEDPWVLADGGWRDELVRLVEATMYGDPMDPSSFGVNTASPQTISTWNRKILGARILDQCAWKGATNRTVKEKLSKLVTLRGDIAHGGRPAGLTLGMVRGYRDFVNRLAKEYDDELFEWVAASGTGLPGAI